MDGATKVKAARKSCVLLAIVKHLKAGKGEGVNYCVRFTILLFILLLGGLLMSKLRKTAVALWLRLLHIHVTPSWKRWNAYLWPYSQYTKLFVQQYAYIP